MGREIGIITEVKGVSVKAELFELLPPYITDRGITRVAPRINTYVKTKVGLDVIICQINGEYYDGNAKGLFTGYYLELEVKGFFSRECFVQGLRLLPIVSASIELLDDGDLKAINESEQGESFILGKDLYDNSQKIYLSYNKIIPTHIGVFGNTGSGKSNTLTRLLHEYSSVLEGNKNGRVIVFDLNNEYGHDSICDIDRKTIYRLSTRKKDGQDRIPFDLGSISEDEWCALLNATEATQKPVIKTAFKDTKTKEQYEAIIKQTIRSGRYQLIKSIQHYMSSYVNGIDNFYWNSTTSAYYYSDGTNDYYWDKPMFNEFLDKIEVIIPSDALELMLFKLYFATANHIGYGTQYDYISPLLRRAEKIIADLRKVFIFSQDSVFGNSNIIIVQMADVNNDMMEIIPSVITNRLFEEKVMSKEDGIIKEIVNIVIDEAHNLLYEDEHDSHHKKVTIETFEKAIKEGRKYGLYLWIASQRPSDISHAIISQMHNYFIHKLVNPYDITRIRKAVAFLDENAMNALTVLGAGECIVSGTGVQMPFFVCVDQVDKKYRPNSENVILFGKDGIFTMF